ncbi:MAG: uracil phosphoribosyltransferase [Myxococcales bacterium]|nr:uracil phosphoribosyltransferase [Myxococcales bacterium]
MPITVVTHPLTRHLVTILRDRRTGSEAFRSATRRLAYTLLIEATADLPVASREIETPLERMAGEELSAQIVAVAVLRAGLGLLDAVVDLFPGVTVGYVGVQRDEETAEPEEYYTKFPNLRGCRTLVLEPMLATGGSLSWACQRAREAGATDITALCVVAAPTGVERMERDHPDVRIVTAACDRELDDRFYIRPGLGDMGDRLFGTP